ncbi:cytochrome c oxidase assembly protein [Paenibacillus sp. CC-CFT747]|nr:cytochrome c oxidase assembly protein [Paenibacillus sp. CC-CFT747]
MYLAAAGKSNGRFRKWPVYRSLCWCGGVGSVALGTGGFAAGPIHLGFVAHMTEHMLLGMIAPLLIVMAAPVTLAIRLLPTQWARRVTHFMNLPLIRILVHPVTAAFLNSGGIWLLYTTSLYEVMHGSSMVYFLVHLHFFLSGYLAASSILYVDPVSHRFSFSFRAVVLLLSSAAHSILSKIVYFSPPRRVPVEEAQAGAQLMYYGGDVIEVALITIFCFQWYRAVQVRRRGGNGFSRS